MEQKHETRISKLETKVDIIEKKVDDFSDMVEAIIKLTLLSEQQIKRNKKFDELYEKVIISNIEFSSTLKTIDENLTCMNEELKVANKRISNLESKVDKKFSSLNNKSKVDLWNIIKKYIPALLIGGVSFWILKLLEIIK